MKANIVVAAASMAAFGAFGLQTNTWISGSTDWSAAASYVENRAPNPGDVVIIPAGVTATVSVVSTEAANVEGSSFDVFSKLDRVATQSATSAVVLDIAEGASVTNYCWIVGKDALGTIIKRGLGMIEFGVTTNTYAYNLDINIEDGTLVFPQELQSGVHCYVQRVTVNEGATLITAEDAGRGKGLSDGPTFVYELWGGGTISNRYGSARFNFRSSNPPRYCEFAGTFGSGVRLNIGEKVNLMLTGTNSTVTPEIGAGAVLGFKKIGMQGQRSSMGTGGVTFRGEAGTILYLGEGETSDKSFTAWTLGNYEHIIDAGATGGLELTGTLYGYYSKNLDQSLGMKRLVLTGSNTVPCVFSGTLPTWDIYTTNYNWHVTKRGTGTWRFADKAQTHAGAWTVEDGTLQFESLKQKGVACSLGTATNLMQNYGGKMDESKRADWAFALGGATTRGTMEYVGGTDVACTTRLVAVKGKGGVLKNSTGKIMVFAGASAIEGESSEFAVGGDDTSVTNFLRDVTDGKGTTSFAKEGDGTWVLGGETSFSGTLSVRGGTLLVPDPTKYTWFKFSVTTNFEGSGRAQAYELGIWDESGTRINHYLYPYTNYYSKAYGKLEGTLPEGMCAYWRSGTPSDTYSGGSVRPIEGLFDDGKALVSGRSTYMSPVFTVSGKNVILNTEIPSTWMPIVMHLTNGIGRAASFDLALFTSNGGRNVKGFVMEGSVDGIHWDYLTNIVLEANVTSTIWCGSGAAYTSGKAGTHTGGWPIEGGPEDAELALRNVKSISVAAGARLVAWGGVAPIKGLTVDANGAGTIDGFEFAENGTLDVENLPADGATLPGTYLNCTGFGNIAGWSLSVGGSHTARYKVIESGGVLRVTRVGTILSIR